MEIRLKEADIYKDDDGLWYLSAVYIKEFKYKTVELRIPKILFPLEHGVVRQSPYSTCNDPKPHAWLELPSPQLKLCPTTDDSGVECLYKEVVVEEKTVPMTIAEIEKQLGHKVVIVGEEKAVERE